MEIFSDVGSTPTASIFKTTTKNHNRNVVVLYYKLINAWVSFVVACVQMLDANSKIGLVIPAELLQVEYAKDLRRFLMSSLQRTTIVTFKELVFPDVEQEVVLLLGEKDLNH